MPALLGVGRWRTTRRIRGPGDWKGLVVSFSALTAKTIDSLEARTRWILLEHRPRAARWLARLLLAAASVVVLAAALASRPEKNGIFMDQMTYLLQSVSIAHDGDLRYDPGDRARFLTLGWGGQPSGLFLRRVGDAYAYAKPASYALAAAPLSLVWPNRAPVVLNAILWCGMLWLTFAWLGRRLGDLPSALVAVATWGLAAPMFYVFVIHMDFFLSFLLAAVLHLGLTSVRSDPPAATGEEGAERAPVARVWRAVLLGACAGAMIYTRPLFAPFAVSMLLFWWFAGARRMAVCAALVLLAVAGGATAWHQFGDGSASPYMGERIYVGGADPFTLAPGQKPIIAAANVAFFSAGDLWRQLTLKSAGFLGYLPRFLMNFVCGRRAGMFPYMIPFLVLLLAALAGLFRPGGRRALWVLVPALAYILVLFRFAPHTWEGGGTALGSRYTVQMAPAFVYAFGWARPRWTTAALLCAATVLAFPLFPARKLAHPARTVRDNYTAFQRDKMAFLPVEPELLFLNCDKPGARIRVGSETYFFRLSDHKRDHRPDNTVIRVASGETCRLGLLRLRSPGAPARISLSGGGRPLRGTLSSGPQTFPFEVPTSGSLTMQIPMTKPVVMDFGDPTMFYWPLEIAVEEPDTAQQPARTPMPALLVDLSGKGRTDADAE